MYKKKILILGFLFLSVFLNSFKNNFLFSLEIPALQDPVNDVAGILSAQEKAEIESFLLNNEKISQLQIAVLIIKSLENEVLEDYSIKVAESWKLGSKEKDSGALLLISIDDKKLRIEVGYGLEENLTDAVCSRIIKNVIAPEFKKSDYGSGILQGVKAMTGYALQDETLMEQFKDNDDDSFFGIIIFAIVVGFILLTALRFKSRFGSSYRGYSSSSFRSSSGGSFGGGYSGRGGSFGGGGASGSW